MMNCEAALDLFSGYLEGDLSAQEGAEFAQHLEQCAACHASYESFRYALGDLQSLTLRETSRDEVASVMAAVSQGDSRRAADGRRSSPWLSTAMTHLVAAGVGALLVWILWPQEVRIEELIVEQRVEVPVERIVQVEVPVERIVEIEVPVEVEVERVVTAIHPLQVHFDSFVALNSSLARLADLAAQSAEAQLAELVVAQAAEPATSAAPLKVALQVAAKSPRRSPVSVRLSEGKVSLTTRGSTAEVVPALIAMLSDGDPRTRKIVEDRLGQFRSELGGRLPSAPKRQRSRHTTDVERIKSLVLGSPLDDEFVATPSPSESWRTWWNSRGEELIAFETQLSY